MFEISVNFETSNFDRHEIEIDCPICKLGNWAKLGEIRRRDYLICRGCYSNILLEDHLGGVQKFINQMNNMFKEFK